MAGEYHYADSLIQQALNQADSDSNMSSDTMRHSLLTSIISHSLKSGHNDRRLMEEIEYLIESLSGDEQIAARGC